ncbi:MAG: hypothetical protein GY707_08770 [Desulfobacteraceae bacterium]|nr:hypothetical protein [Desulfobacteraceae bacterium]
MGISHPDFSKLQVMVGYTFDGKTIKALLETNPGSGAAQPRLLMSFPDKVNFTNGKPAKFVSKLQVPFTGSGFATVFAEADPNNRIRETQSGEKRKRIQTRLRARCASLSPAAKHVNVKSGKSSIKLGKTNITIDPNIKKTIKIKANSKFNSENTVTKSRAYINFSRPSNGQVFDQGASIPVEFSYAAPHNVSGVIFLTYVIYSYNRETGVRVNTYYPPEIRVTEGLNPDGGFFEIDSNMIREENFSDYFYKILLSAHDSALGISASGLSNPFNFYGRMIPADSGGGTNPYAVSNGLSITVPRIEGDFCIYSDEIDFHYVCDIDDLPAGSNAQFYLRSANSDVNLRTTADLSVPPLEGDGDIVIHSSSTENLRPFVYKIHGIVRDPGGNLLGTGSSAVFQLKDWCPEIRSADEYSTPVSDGLQIIEPAGSEIFYPGSVINIRYRVDALLPDGATIQFNVERDSPPNNIALIRNVNIRPDGTAEVALLPERNIRWGNYRLVGYVKDISGSTIASGTSGVFRIEYHADTPSEGIEITSPTVDSWYRSTDKIVVSYNFRSCEEVITEGVLINLKHYHSTDHADFFRRHTLFRGNLYQGMPLPAAGTMSFDIPSAAISDESFGEEGCYRIEIYTNPERVPYHSEECMALSESFRISR